MTAPFFRTTSAECREFRSKIPLLPILDELTFEVVFNNHGFVNNYGFHLIDYLIRDSDKTLVVYGVEVINTAFYFLPPSTTVGMVALVVLWA
jgi:hypothetical protein